MSILSSEQFLATSVVLAGYVVPLNGNGEDFAVVRLTAGGAVDPSFNGGSPVALALAQGSTRGGRRCRLTTGVLG
jgi:hypothetical protein